MDVVAGGSDAAPETVDPLLPAPLAVRRWRRIVHMDVWSAAERRARRLARAARRR
jgi:hypothetical protein